MTEDDQLYETQKIMVRSSRQPVELVSSVAEDDQLYGFHSWGVFEWTITTVIFAILCYILLKADNPEESSNIRNAEANSSEQNRTPREEKRENNILKLFLSEQIQKKLTSEDIRRTSCRCETTGASSSTPKECQTITTICDRRLDDDDGETSFDEEEGHGTVVLPSFPPDKKSKNDENNKERLVSNLCAICLEDYHEGETIVWSSNKNCPHAFHRDCLVSYLVKVKTKHGYPCPCCRRNFFFDETKDEYKNEDVNENVTASESETETSNETSSELSNQM